MTRPIRNPFPAIIALLCLLPAAAFADPPGSDCTTQTEISQSECEGLAAIYDDMGGSSWEFGWSGNNPCNWSGVTCTDPPTPRQVISFGMSFNTMSGSLPAEIGNLIHLETFAISAETSVDGPIPSTIGNLTQLETLVLEDVDLSGTIPAEIGDLVNLQQLTLTGSFTGGLPAEIGNLVNLRFLDIERFRNSDPGLQGPIPDEFGDLVSLELLSLEKNSIGHPLPSTIGGLTNLQQFRAEEAGITGPLPASMEELDNLTFLDLSRNQLEGPLPEELAGMASLDHLDLDGNGIDGSIPAAWENFPNLRILELQRNRLTGNLPPEIGQIASLRGLSVEDNHLDGPLISTFVGTMADPVSLLLAGNDFTGDVPSEWVDDGNFNNLTVSWNCLTVTDPDAIALLDMKDPGWDMTQCIRIFADGFETAGTQRWDATEDGS